MARGAFRVSATPVPGPEGTIEISDPGRLAPDPVVSVVMLAYNHAEHLARAMESVLRQQAGFPFELLVGEDCSTDGSRAIAEDLLRKHPETVRIITSERNVGAYRNCMRLFAAARGEFIAQIDGDDYWFPAKLSLQLDALRSACDAVAAYSNAIVVDRTGAAIGLFNDVPDSEFGLAELLRRGNFLCTSTMMFRASLLDALRGVGREFIDFQTQLEAARRGRLLYRAEPLAAYRAGSSGSMVANDNPRVRELYWQAIQSVPRELVSDDDYAHGIADFLRRVFFRCVRTRDWSLWREWKPRVFAASPRGAARTYWLTAANILRMAAKEAVGRFRRDASGQPLRVLYRR